jgi:hypothetical protein
MGFLRQHRHCTPPSRTKIAVTQAIAADAITQAMAPHISYGVLEVNTRATANNPKMHSITISSKHITLSFMLIIPMEPNGPNNIGRILA